MWFGSENGLLASNYAFRGLLFSTEAPLHSSGSADWGMACCSPCALCFWICVSFVRFLDITWSGTPAFLWILFISTCAFISKMIFAKVWLFFCLIAFAPGSNCWEEQQDTLHTTAPAVTTPEGWISTNQFTHGLPWNLAISDMVIWAKKRQEDAV